MGHRAERKTTITTEYTSYKRDIQGSCQAYYTQRNRYIYEMIAAIA